jgi:3-oxoacyl-[acyl-carrier-protein] synthase II
MKPANHVVITGQGCVSALGLSATETWDRMRLGRTGIGPLTRVPASDTRVGVAAELKGFVATDHFDARGLQLLDWVFAGLVS